MLNQFAFIGFLLIVALILGAATPILARLVRPQKAIPRKLEMDECDMRTHGETWVEFKAQYYTLVIVFLLFDVAAVFLLPWALAYNTLELYTAIEVIAFILMLLGGLVYLWRKGALEWL